MRLLPAACLTVLAAAQAYLPAARASDLTADELRWLQAAAPVLEWGRTAGLPLDVVVQPQAAPDAPPLGMAWMGGRCKLVLTMRGNPQVQATEQRVAPALLGAAIGVMAAHEIGHCSRYVAGAWFRTPAGFDEPAPRALPAALRPAYDDMRATRREEAYADLVGLAWAQRQHPGRYADLQRWLLAERQRERVPGTHHDTVPWLQRAVLPQALAPGSMLDAAEAVWSEGLAAGD